MKITATCCLGLLMIIGSTLTAQRKIIQPPTPSCDGQGDLIELGSQFRFNACHWGFNPYETILSPATVGNLVLDWQYTTAYYVYSSPAIANGAVYVASGDANLAVACTP